VDTAVKSKPRSAEGKAATATNGLGHVLYTMNKNTTGEERKTDLLVQGLRDHRGTHLHEKLSDREFQVLCLIGEGKTVKQIAEALSLSAPTISTYRARILDKMDMRTTAQLKRYFIQNGLAKPK
jgi:DNA-binding NarL/FixJ family response regulator